MSIGLTGYELPTSVRRALDDVRWRIRAYVWLQGLAIIAAVLGLGFWLGLAADWSFEPGVGARKSALIVFAVLAASVAYRYLLRRVAAPISDTSAALLLERRFPELGEHLLTSVDVAASADGLGIFHPTLIQETQQAAARAVSDVRTGALFDRGPLLRAIGAALALASSIVAFAVLSPTAFSFWMQRIALTDQPWPRRVSLEVQGFPTDSEGRRVQKLAQDDDYELVVHAGTDGHEAPSEVEIRFRLPDGRRGRDTMLRVGEAQAGRDEFQLFRYQFKHVADNMDFDVVGGDDRVRDLHLQVVDRPELFGIELDCQYPDYLGREPRRLSVTGGMRIPEGTRLTLHANSTKALQAIRIHRGGDKQDAFEAFLENPQRELDWAYGVLNADDVLLVTVTDADGVSSREPYRVSLSVVRDELPQVSVRLAGIGTAITPDAILPLAGKITDDYGLDRAWFEYQVDAGPMGTRPLEEQPNGSPVLAKLGQFDTRALEPGTEKRSLELRPGQHFSLWLKASDRYDLGDLSQEASQGGPVQPRSGSSQQFSLDVVTPSDLLALLEKRELALRQHYQSVYEKMTDTRNLLSRVQFGASAEDATVPLPARDKPDENSSAEEQSNSENAAQRALARRKLRLAGSLQNVMQSAAEIAGVAEGFDDLGDQLTNNRIDNPELKNRLEEQIARPLHRIAEERMPQLAAQLKLVEEHVSDAANGPEELAKAVAIADQVLVEMKQVLDKMLELETYNEVVSLLRNIISDQNEINRRTKERQKEKLRKLFEE